MNIWKCKNCGEELHCLDVSITMIECKCFNQMDLDSGEIIKREYGSEYSNHRKIWEYHHGKIPKGMVIHHINGEKKDNRIHNLQMMTPKEHSLIHKSSYNQK